MSKGVQAECAGLYHPPFPRITWTSPSNFSFQVPFITLPKQDFFLDEAEKKEKEQLLQKSAGAWAASNHCQEKIVLKIQCVALWVACGLAPLPSRDQCNIGAAVFPECFSSVALSQETEYLRPQT